MQNPCLHETTDRSLSEPRVHDGAPAATRRNRIRGVAPRRTLVDVVAGGLLANHQRGGKGTQHTVSQQREWEFQTQRFAVKSVLKHCSALKELQF